MKKLGHIFLLFLLCFSLSSCSSSPDTMIESYCEAMKTFDYMKMKEFLENTDASTEDPFQSQDSMEDATMAYLKDYLTNHASKISYTITSVNENADSATVTVDFEYADLSPMIASVMDDYISQALALAFSGVDDDKTYEQLLISLIKEKSASYEPLLTSETVQFICHKTNHEWKITETPDAIINIMTGNIQKTLDSMGTEETESNEAEDPIKQEPLPTDEELISIYAEAMYRLHHNDYGNTRDYTQTITVDGNTYVKLVGKYDTPEKLYNFYHEFLCTDLATESYTKARSNMYIENDIMYVVDADGGYLPEPENAVVLERKNYETLQEVYMLLEIPCGDSYNIENVHFMKEDNIWKVSSYYSE